MADINGFNIGGNDNSFDQRGHFWFNHLNAKVVGMAAKQNGTPNMTVLVEAGTALLSKNTISCVVAEVKSDTAVTVSTANVSNPRIDALVVYEDTGVAMPTSLPYAQDGDNGRFKLTMVDGTAAATPTAPSDSTIQSSIGAGKPFMRLANVTVATNTTTITDSAIADIRVAYNPASDSTNQYCFSASSSGASGLTSDNTYDMHLDTKIYDPSNMLNLSTNEVTIPVSGVYSFTFRAYINMTGLTNARLYLSINGNERQIVFARGESYMQPNASVQVKLDANDKIRFRIRVFSSGNWQYSSGLVTGAEGHLVTRI